ncbi:geranylgeranyl diphosphate synthase type II [Nocardia transvalensis]|uniref:Geranylgeranyl diphosphate synthase type II n=1 Tax=Nocardia transvalensis TaxID=37333 RepID=A0A7W9UGA2_9NOCA|nr:polyprenyl synthetase family protein [Nocardia transvalensis]MBB5911942.1 geranylgeranyl diphosphate synthase type II [Nocardia transvalensis]
MTTDLTAAAEITGVGVLAGTIAELAGRAPAVVAAAAAELGSVRVQLHFGDGTHAVLRVRRSRLDVAAGRIADPAVEVHFDERAMNLVFDLSRRPADEVRPASLDVRGRRDDVLAVWRTLRLLSQRAAGIRAVQELWRRYREQAPLLWGTETHAPAPPDPVPSGLALPRRTGWRALDYLGSRIPSGRTELTLGTTDRRPSSLWDGHTSTGWWETAPVWDADLLEMMRACRDRVGEEMDRLIPERNPKAALYDLMRSYPTRQGKGLRPTLTIAACAAFGGRPEDAVRTAAALELFHNGFLVHDDIADESTHRRGKPTLHEKHGVGLAVNAGDGLNLLAIDGVLANLDSLGLARTLGLIHEVLHMCRETVEGQAVELDWIRRNTVPRADRAYYDMSTKKTGWYTCISPCRLGAVCAGETAPARLDALNEAFRWVGIAFQIQDDVLNLVGEEELYGKEPLGDLLEGKRTVMLIHLMRTAPERDRLWLRELLALQRDGRSQDDAERILHTMHRHGSIEYALDVADTLARRGTARFEADLAFLPENEGKGVLRQIANYVVTRPL